jgi:hypothetical protein
MHCNLLVIMGFMLFSEKAAYLPNNINRLVFVMDK